VWRPVRAGVLAIGSVVLCAAPALAGAQQVISTLDAQVIRLRYTDAVDATATGLSPALRIDWDNAMVRASGTYARFAHAWSADGILDANVFSPSVGPFSAALAGTLGGSTHQDGARTGTAIGLGRLQLKEGPVGAWLGAGGGATSDGLASHRVREGDGGVWWGTGSASLTVAAAPTAIDDSIRYTDLTAEGNWRGGIVELSAVAGVRSGSRLPLVASDAKSWGSIDAIAWLLPRVALMASVGTYPVDFTQSFPGGRFVSAGVRISLSPREHPPVGTLDRGSAAESSGILDFQLGPAERGGRTLRVRAPGAHRVDVNGDFTEWSPRAMTSESGGWFELTIPVKPGTYQMNIRVDNGDWTVPPSLPTVRDEFGGLAGVLVVQ